MNNDQYVKEIDLVELFVKILKKWRFVLFLAFLCALLAGGWKTVSGFEKLNDPEFMKEKQDEIEKKQQEYESQKVLYEAQIENINQEIEVQNQYLDNSLYMSIDPYNEFQEVLSYYITTDYQIMPGMQYQNVNTLTSIINAYGFAADNTKVYEAVSKKLEEPVDIAFLRELVSISRDNGNGMLTITVYSPDEETASLIITEMQDAIMGSKDSIFQSFGNHEITEAVHTKRRGVDTGLVDKLSKYNDSNTKLQDALVKRRSELNALEEPKDELPTRRNVAKNAVKYMILGGILGGFLACAWICFLFIMGDKIPNERDLKRLYGMSILGRYHEDNKKGIFSNIDRKIEELEGIKASNYDPAKAFAIAAANIESAVEDQGVAMLISSVSDEKLKDTYQKLISAGILKESGLRLGGNILDNPDTIRELSEVDSVVFVEDLNTSRGSALAQAVDKVKRSGKRILGIVEIS